MDKHLNTESKLFDCMGATWYKWSEEGAIYIQLIGSRYAVKVRWSRISRKYMVSKTMLAYSHSTYYWDGSGFSGVEGTTDSFFTKINPFAHTLKGAVEKQMYRLANRESPPTENVDVVPGVCR